MTVEGAVAILAAALSGSVALLGFGIDSAIEGPSEHHRDLAVWWLDPAIALAVVPVALKEAREAWRGEGCCS